MLASEDKEVVPEIKKYSFIEEKIVPRRKRKMKKLINSAAKIGVLAIVFGFVSSLVFCFTSSHFNKALGRGEQKKMILFTSPSPSPVVTSTPDEKPEEVKIIEKTVDATLSNYSKMFSLISNVASQFNYSVVTVSSVLSGEDWFDNPAEITDASYGVVIANNEKELLILASKDKIKNANSVRITFIDNYTVDAKLKGYDEDTGIGILAVPLENIPESTIEKVTIAELGESYYLTIGLPVLALGSPNGNVYSMEIGIVTNKSKDKYITDYKLELYNTDITHNPKGEGVITNLEGTVLGIITHEYNDELNENVSTVMGITKLKPIIEKLVNEEEQVYFGVTALDIPQLNLDKIGAGSGIYISEVDTDSPAIMADIRCGDVITKIEGEKINSVTNFYDTISGYKKEDVIKVTVLRSQGGKSKEQTKKVVLKYKSDY